MARGSPETRRQIPLDLRINRWFQLEPEELKKAVINLTSQKDFGNKNLSFYIGRVESYKKGGHIEDDIAQDLIDHLRGLPKKRLKKRRSKL